MSNRAADPTPDPLRNGTDAAAPPEREWLLDRHATDPRLAAAALALRQELIEQYGAHSAVDRALVEGAVTGHYFQQLLATWTAVLAETVERDLFHDLKGNPGSPEFFKFSIPGVETALRQIANQMLLQERAARLVARNLAALHDRARQSQAGRDH